MPTGCRARCSGALPVAGSSPIQKWPRPHWLCLMSLWIPLSAVGCGNKLSIVPAEGTVTFDGKPLAAAAVVFQPVKGGRLSHGKTDKDGRYRLTYVEGQWGAFPGTHRVSISTFVEPNSDSSDPAIQSGQKEIIPAKYNTQTTLEAKLPADRNDALDFALKSS